MHSLLFLIPLVQQPAGPSPTASIHDSPRALTVADAVVQIGDIHGRIALTSDLDGDGIADLAIQRGDGTKRPWRIDAISTKDGRRIRQLWVHDQVIAVPTDWDIGGDIDADCVSDLLIAWSGESDAGATATGEVLAFSGSTGEMLHRTHGRAPTEGYGTSLTFLGDIDEDGHDDYVVGAIQAPPLDRTSARAGDLDADGVSDLCQFEWIGFNNFNKVRFLSGRTRAVLFELASLSNYSHYAFAAEVGDLDGDGCDGIAIGDADVNIDPFELGRIPKLTSMSVPDALSLGDGSRDLLVAGDKGSAWIFAGPGTSTK